MASWKRLIAELGGEVEHLFDAARTRLRQRFRTGDDFCVVPYRGFGTPHKLYLRGRAIEDPSLTLAGDNDSLWANIVNMYRRFESDELPGARVRARLAGAEQEVVANQEGYFEVWLDPARPLAGGKLWHDLDLELVSPRREGHGPSQATGSVLIPPPNARFGIISDIDDTVVRTEATDLLRMARNTFLHNARTRLPFEGVAALYRALHQGAPGEFVNPIFYVSSSPWNLYDLLDEFFALQGIPAGPIFLRDWGVSRQQAGRSRHHTHKLAAIRQLLDFYPDLPFILIGDSGQHDPEIYAEVVDAYPRRILAVYIRNVSREPKRIDAIRALAQHVVSAGSVLMLADDTLAMAQHALEQGWIASEALPEIRGEKAADAAPPSILERLLGEEDQVEAPTVVVASDTPGETAAAIDTGAVEAALQTTGDQAAPPPTVIVDQRK